MNKQIVKGWVTKLGSAVDETYLLKGLQDEKNDEYWDVNFDSRKLSNLITNALSHLGFQNLFTDVDESEENIVDKRVAKNISMQIYSSEKNQKLDSVKEKIILDSMGLLEYREDWCGYSEWTIEGYEIETFTLGGHNILDIINNLEGKFIYLVIDKYEGVLL